MSKVSVAEFKMVAKEKYNVTLVDEQAHELALRYSETDLTVEQSVADYIDTYGLLNQS